MFFGGIAGGRLSLYFSNTILVSLFRNPMISIMTCTLS